MARPSVSSLPPLSACPETSKANPWRVAEGFFSDDGLYHISSSSAFKVESLEFYPNHEAYPNCYFRFSADSVAGEPHPYGDGIVAIGGDCDNLGYLDEILWILPSFGGFHGLYRAPF